MNEKSLKALGLTEDQLKQFRELQKKEEVLRVELQKCKVSKNAIPHIISKSDVSIIDTENTEALDEAIRNEWKEFIFD